MKRVVLSISMLLLCIISFAQVPQGFNYQAIARDGISGDPLINTPLEALISIQDDSLGSAIIWEELHTSITTNDYGMFSLYIGKGKRQGSSTVLAFNDINWGELPKYINAKILYDDEWHNMGSARFWSVPYSMVAGNINDTLNKLFVKGETTDMEEALFQVKNKDGQIIFAVYNEGVRIYVADGESKGKKGGFAIGGFGAGKADVPGQEYFVVSRDSIRAYIYDDPLVKRAKGGFAIGGFGAGKGFTNDYLLISPDSARVYIDNAPSSKGKKGGFAIGGFGAGKEIDGQEFLTVSGDSIRMYIDDDPLVKRAKGGFAIGGFGAGKAGNSDRFFDVATDATGIINPSQNRILWYPLKNAFLTGKVLIEKPDSVGENSFASGYESKARGDYSQALGFNVISRGNYATAIGKNAIAHAENSVSIGNHSRANNISSFAFGTGAIALGENSYAIGSSGVDSAGFPTGNTMSIGEQSFAIGMGSIASGTGSVTLGLADTASGSYAMAMGYKTSAIGEASLAVGKETKALEFASFSSGYKTTASGKYSTALGEITYASGDNSTSTGRLTHAKGYSSTALGYGTTSEGSASLATGSFSIAHGDNSMAGGYITEAYGKGSLAFGDRTVAGGDYSVALGSQTYSSSNALAAGSNTSAEAINSIALGNGSRTIGENSFAFGYETKASSYCLSVFGKHNIDWSTLYSQNSWVNDDPLFVIGNGLSTTNRSNALTVLKNGNVGIGDPWPLTKLSITGLTGTTSGYYMRIYNNNVYYYSSSAKNKTDIYPLQEDFLKILQAQPVSFTDKVSGEKNIGYIAEDFDAIGLKNLVIYKDGEPSALSYELISLYNLEVIKDQQKAIKEQKHQIESYKSENDNLKSQLQILHEKVEQIEALIANVVLK